MLYSFFRFSLYLKLMLSAADLPLVLSWTTKQAVHYKLLQNTSVWILFALKNANLLHDIQDATKQRKSAL